jgi:F420-dependent methylenetetrahydromethanopterin dehydrogenase
MDRLHAGLLGLVIGLFHLDVENRTDVDYLVVTSATKDKPEEVDSCSRVQSRLRLVQTR